MTILAAAILPLTFVAMLLTTERAPDSSGILGWTGRTSPETGDFRLNFVGLVLGVASVGTLLNSRRAAQVAGLCAAVLAGTAFLSALNPEAPMRGGQASMGLIYLAFSAALARRLVVQTRPTDSLPT